MQHLEPPRCGIVKPFKTFVFFGGFEDRPHGFPRIHFSRGESLFDLLFWFGECWGRPGEVGKFIVEVLGRVLNWGVYDPNRIAISKNVSPSWADFSNRVLPLKI